MFYGIDLGTTNSCVAYVEDDQIKVVVNSYQSQTTKSVVYFENAKDYCVGQAAEDCRELDPASYVECIKREMTKDYTHSTSPFPHCLTPTEISAKILRHLVNEANDSERVDCDDVVITVPARFDSAARERTRDAARIAGLNVLDLVSEPTAAVAGYRDMLIRRDELPNRGEKILVFDLGGGTFDISICEISEDSLQVIMTGGDEHLGGHDWDLELARHIVEDKLEKDFDGLSPEMQNHVVSKAENAKKLLSKLSMAPVRGLNGVSTGQEDVVVTRKEFERWTHELCGRTISRLRDTLERARASANIDVDDIDEVLLVGGSTYMPQIQEALADLFGASKLKKYQPELIVAIGAAAYNRIREKERKSGEEERVISDVVGRTYGFNVISSSDDHEYIENLILASDETPAEKETTVVTRYDDQTAASFAVWESDSLDDNVELDCAKRISDESELKLPDNLPKGTKIKIKYSVDKSAILHVRAQLARDSRYNMEFDVKLLGTLDKRELLAAQRKIGHDLS